MQYSLFQEKESRTSINCFQIALKRVFLRAAVLNSKLRFYAVRSVYIKARLRGWDKILGKSL